MGVHCLSGGPGQHQHMRGGEREEKNQERQDMEQVSAVGHWGPILQETSGRECPAVLSYFNWAKEVGCLSASAIGHWSEAALGVGDMNLSSSLSGGPGRQHLRCFRRVTSAFCAWEWAVPRG